MSPPPERGDRFYAILLRLYPAEFRARYGRAMRDFHRDRVAIARQTGESMAVLWLSAVVDVALSAAAEHLRPFLSGDAVLETIRHDLRYAVRNLARRPAFTAIIVATIALGVGVNAAIFSVVNGILLRPLAYPAPDQLFAFGHEAPTWLASEPDFVDYKREMKTLSGLAAYAPLQGTLALGDAPERIHVARGSADFFPLLGVEPQLGRTFAGDEFVPRLAQVIVLSDALWRRSFGGDPAILGRKITFEGAPRIVIGVMPAGFAFPGNDTEAWLPLPRFNPDSLGDRASHYLWMVGRLKPKATLDAARAEANGIARRIMLAEPAKFDPKSPLRPVLTNLTDQLVGKTRPYLLALLGAVGFVLLIACANVANLLLVRGEARRKEIALRSALGASRRRIVVQLLTESLVLAAAGAAIGLGLAWSASRAFVATAPSSVPRASEVTVDWRVLAFTAVVTILTAALVGVVPAWKGARGDAADMLREGGKTTGDGSSSVARRALVVAEMAVAVAMLAGAGMLLRSMWHLQQAGLGFRPDGVLTAKISLSARRYDDARANVFFGQLLARVRAIPGVRSAGASGWLPVVDAGGLWAYRPDNGGVYPDGRWPAAVPQQATPGYFSTIGIPLLEGRDFNDADRADGELVAIVSRKFADLTWPGASAVGKRFGLGNDAPFVRVVGVVGDIRGRGFGDVPEPTMYFPYAQSAKSAYVQPLSVALLVRVDGNPLAITRAVRDALLALDRTAPLSDVRTLEQVAGESLAVRRFNTMLLAAFAGLALVLAGIGTYGVISYGVSQRRFEIGVRIALGAHDRSVLALVMAEGMRLALIGLAIGLVAAIAIGRIIRAMLVDVGPVDSPSLALTAALLVIVAAVASFVPALRALRVSPLDALRGR
jgi:putative ABC transport system permease protein